MKRPIVLLPAIGLAIAVMLFACYVWYHRWPGRSPATGGRPTGAGSLPSKPASSLPYGGHDSHEHTISFDEPGLEEMASIRQEEFDRVTAMLEGGPPAYRSFQQLVSPEATTRRASEFEVVRVKCKAGRELFDEFAISADEIKYLADASPLIRSRQAFRSSTSADGTRIDTPVGEPERQIVIPSTEMHAGRMPLKLYDNALLAAQERLIDNKLIQSFLEKNKLAPALKSFQAELKWVHDGLHVRVSSSDAGWNVGVMELTLPVTPQDYAARQQQIDDEINLRVTSWFYHVGITAFETQIDQYVPGGDRKTFTGNIDRPVSPPDLMKFLRANAEIERNFPDEVKNDIWLQEQIRNR